MHDTICRHDDETELTKGQAYAIIALIFIIFLCVLGISAMIYLACPTFY